MAQGSDRSTRVLNFFLCLYVRDIMPRGGEESDASAHTADMHGLAGPWLKLRTKPPHGARRQPGPGEEDDDEHSWRPLFITHGDDDGSAEECEPQ